MHSINCPHVRYFEHGKNRQSGRALTALLAAMSFNVMPFIGAASAANDSNGTIDQVASKNDDRVLLACASCGCSEVCPLTLVDPSQSSSSLLTESIWGNIILKMAYRRDPELQRMAKKLNLSNSASTASFVGIAGGTLGQNISSMYALNPPEGHEDSYGPGCVGLALDGVTNIVFGARTVVGHHYRKMMKARQLEVRQRVERLVEHLEYSKTDCSEAQSELATLIGERASKECLQLWHSSHLAVTTPDPAPHPVSDSSPDPHSNSKANSTQTSELPREDTNALTKAVVEKFATARAF